MTRFKSTNCPKCGKPIKDKIDAIDSFLLDRDKIALRSFCCQIWTITPREPRLERFLLKI